MTDLRTDVTITDLPSPAPGSPVEALERLGGTADEVAEGLRARGIKARQVGSVSDNCPLAVYLQTWWPKAFIALTMGGMKEEIMVFSLPEPVIGFRLAFDFGGYPDLRA